jgi:hypothetical protein
MRRHPASGAEQALQQCGQIQVRIETWEVEPEAGWRDFDCRKIRRSGVFQALSIARRECHVEAVSQCHDHPVAAPVIPCRNGFWSRRLQIFRSRSGSIGLLTGHHEFAPICRRGRGRWVRRRGAKNRVGQRTLGLGRGALSDFIDVRFENRQVSETLFEVLNLHRKTHVQVSIRAQNARRFEKR